MEHTKRKYGIIGVVICLLWLAACGSPAPTSAPTVDLNPLRTEVASTVVVQVLQNLALTPSATCAACPTASPLPSSTSTSTIAFTATPTQQIGETPGISPTLPTETPTVDRAQWVSQSIPDDTVFAPGQTFTMTWTLKNVGTSTWTTDYVLRFFSGNAFGAPNEVPLDREVLPGDTIDITLKMKAPLTAGVYRSDWVLSTGDRSNFKDSVYLQIKVAVPATPTATTAPSQTPTPGS